MHYPFVLMENPLQLTANSPIFEENVTHYNQVSIITEYTIVDTLVCNISISENKNLKKVHYKFLLIRKFAIGRILCKS